jgi:hypothetical protein
MRVAQITSAGGIRPAGWEPLTLIALAVKCAIQKLPLLPSADWTIDLPLSDEIFCTSPTHVAASDIWQAWQGSRCTDNTNTQSLTCTALSKWTHRMTAWWMYWCQNPRSENITYLLLNKRNKSHVRFDVFTEVRMMMIFRVLLPCRLIRRCQRSGETYCLHLQGGRWRLYVSPKRWHLPTSLHGAKTQKNINRRKPFPLTSVE